MRRPGAGTGLARRTARVDHPIAIVGLSAHFGPFDGTQAFQERVLGAESRDRAGCDRGIGGERPRPLGIAARDGTTSRSRVSIWIHWSSESASSESRPRSLGRCFLSNRLMLRVAAEAIRRRRLGPATRAPNGRLDRDRAGLELDQLPPALVAGRPGARVEQYAGTRPFAAQTSTAGSRNCAGPRGRLCQPTGRWDRWAA